MNADQPAGGEPVGSKPASTGAHLRPDAPADSPAGPGTASTGAISRGPATHVPVRAFRQDLAALLRRAATGDQLVVTVDGRPLAAVGPLGGAEPSLDALIASGQLIAPRRRDAGTFDPQSIWAGTRLDQAFAEIRGR